MPKGKQLIILLIEDNVDHAELIRRGLQEHCLDNRIIHLEDGETALDYLHHRGVYKDTSEYPAPDLLLLDLRLPKVDGLEVLREVKSYPETKSIPVVILTSSQADRDISNAYKSYVNSYLVKPVEFDQFASLMHELNFYWVSWNTYPKPIQEQDETK